MPIQATTPIEHDGQSYPYYGINIAISPQWRPTEIRASVAVRLTPFRVDEATGEIHPLHEQVRPVVFADAFAAGQADPAVAAAVNGIMDAIQQYVTAKGL